MSSLYTSAVRDGQTSVPSHTVTSTLADPNVSLSGQVTESASDLLQFLGT